ncbi:MAG: VOC family protein [Alphaproteobacteria bacterium]
MFDHISIGVTDLGRAICFYKACLAPLGWEMVTDLRPHGEPVVAFGRNGAPALWLAEESDGPVTAIGTHVAFPAPDHDAVDEFHTAGLQQGGTCNGPPGIRDRYDPTYYAAFLKDPDGHHVEAVHASWSHHHFASGSASPKR